MPARVCIQSETRDTLEAGSSGEERQPGQAEISLLDTGHILTGNDPIPYWILVISLLESENILAGNLQSPFHTLVWHNL
jgi:hypothetical protein